MTFSEIDRRAVLRGVAVVGAGASLAACGGEEPAEVAPAAAETEATAIGDVKPPSPAPSSAAAGGAAAENALGSAADVPVGGGVIYAGQKVVVTQPTADNFKAFTAVCPHAGCAVSTVDKSAGAILCPCHGSRFSLTDGSVLNGPATEPLKEQNVTVTGGMLKLG